MSSLPARHAVPASSVREGDEILVGRETGFCVVTSVSRDGSGRVRITYIKRGEDSWSRVWHRTPWLVERGLRPLDPDEIVRVQRGSLDRADEARLAMQYEFEDRMAS